MNFVILEKDEFFIGTSSLSKKYDYRIFGPNQGIYVLEDRLSVVLNEFDGEFHDSVSSVQEIVY